MSANQAAELTDDDFVNGCVYGPDGYAYRPPPPSKQLTIDMQVSVTECTSWRGVLDVVDRFGDLFEGRNTSTAVHRVARFGAEEHHLVVADARFPRLLQLLRAKCKDLTAWSISDAAWGLAKLQVRDEELFRRISKRAQAMVHELDPQALALTAWGFATVGHFDEQLMVALAEAARKKLPEFAGQNISNLVWATATLGFRYDPLHDDLVRIALSRLEDFTCQELAIVNWAFTKLAYPVGDAWRSAFRARVMSLKEYAPSEVSMVAWALATRGDYDPDLMAYIARRSMELMRLFTGQNIATVLWAVATVSYKDDPCIDELLRTSLGAIIARTHEFQPLNIALISWALAKLSYRAEVAFEALCGAAARQINDFVPQNLVQLIWACATSGYRHDELMLGAARVAKQRARDFSSQHLSNFLWACARLGYKDDIALLRALGDEALRKMHDGSPQHLSNICWAISQLGPQHFSACLDGIVRETSRRLADFDPPSLMMISDSLYEAQYGRGREAPLLQALRGHIVKMGDELRDIFTRLLPPRRGLGPPAQVAEYQRRLRAVGLVTFGYEHTMQLFSDLCLFDGPQWEAVEAAALEGWTKNARRTTAARRYEVQVGHRRLQDPGTIFTSAFAAASDDSACDFAVVWLGQGKADSPNVGRAGRSGDAECRAIVDTHRLFAEAMREGAAGDVTGWVALHTSGVPCLSCVGVAAQFKRCYPGVRVSFTFVQREAGWDAPDVVVAPAVQGSRAVTPGSTSSTVTPDRSMGEQRYQQPPMQPSGVGTSHMATAVGYA